MLGGVREAAEQRERAGLLRGLRDRRSERENLLLQEMQERVLEQTFYGGVRPPGASCIGMVVCALKPGRVLRNGKAKQSVKTESTDIHRTINRAKGTGREEFGSSICPQGER